MKQKKERKLKSCEDVFLKRKFLGHVSEASDIAADDAGWGWLNG